MARHRLHLPALLLAAGCLAAWAMWPAGLANRTRPELDAPPRDSQPVAAAGELPDQAAHPSAASGDRVDLHRERAAPPIQPEQIEARTIDLTEPIVPPADPTEVGDCNLELFLIDATTGEAVFGYVDLWRISAPKNDHWTRGDQLQQTVSVPLEGATVSKLPSGVYRAHVTSARRGAPASNEFAVIGSWTTQRVPVYRPLPREVLLQLFNEQGEPISKASFKRGSRSSRRVLPLTPWRQQRELHTGQIVLNMHGLGGGWGGAAHQRWKEHESTPRGFSLGRFNADTRTTSLRQRMAVRLAPSFEITVTFELGASESSPVLFAAPFLPLERLLESVTFPGGRAVEIADGQVQVELAAVRLNADSPSDAWRQAPFTVRINIPGYEECRISGALLTNPLPPQELQPAESIPTSAKD